MQLIRFDVYCGRMGSIEGVFVLNERGVKTLNSIVENECEIHFGDVLGKHSDISFEIKPQHYTVVTEDTEKIKVVLEAFGLNSDTNRDYWTLSGINPLDYYDALNPYGCDEE